MNTTRRIRPAADVAIGYAADERGSGLAYATVNTGAGPTVVRLPFRVAPLTALDGLENGYAAVAALARHLRARGLSRVRVRAADVRVVADLNGAGSPPKALAMDYVKIRCLLNGLGAARLELADTTDVADLAARARAELHLHVAA